MMDKRWLIFLAIILVPVTGWAKTLLVPQDYSRIGEAIAAARPGDRIVIAAGQYHENLVIDKDLILESHPLPPRAFIPSKRWPERKWVLPEERYVDLKAEDSSRPIITVRGSAQVTLIGFLIHGGPQGLVIADQAHAILLHGLIFDQTLNGAIVGGEGALELRNSQVLLNYGDPALVVRDTARLSLRYSLVDGNIGGGILIHDQAQAELYSSKVSGNLGAGILVRDGAEVEIHESTIADNATVGIMLKDRAQATITASNIVDEVNGLAGGGEAKFTITDTEFSGNDRGLYLSEAAGAELSDCAFFDNETGVELHDESSATITASRFAGGETAISGEDRTHLVLRESEITGEETEESFLWITWTIRTNGIIFTGAEAFLESNTIENCRIGVQLGFDEPYAAWQGHALLRDNLIRGQGEVGVLVRSGRAELEGNEIRSNRLGVAALTTAQLTLKGNTIDANVEHGVVLAQESQAELIGNRFADNGGCGVYVGPWAVVELQDNEFSGEGLGRCGRAPGSLQEQIAAAPEGATLTIPPGTYWESLYIDKPLTLEAEGEGVTLIGDGLEPVIAVHLEGPEEVRLIGLTIKSGAPGIALELAPEAVERPKLTLEGCTITANSGGLIAKEGWRLTITHCTFTKNGKQGIELWDAEAVITETTVAEQEGTGISINKESTATLEQLTVKGNKYGIETGWGTQITLARSMITENHTGLELESSGAYVHDNTIVDNEWTGISVEGSAVILRNEIRGSDLGVEGRGKLDLRYNEITANNLGVEIIGGEATVSYNKINANAGDGLRLRGGRVEIRGNEISENEGWGIAAWIQACYPENPFAPEEFRGKVTGKKNKVHDNAQGDLCGVPESLLEE